MVRDALASEGWKVESFSARGKRGSTALDLRDPRSVKRLLSSVPDLVVNCAALSTGAACLRSPSSAWALNSVLPGLLSRLCRSESIPLLHVSTDLVYSGANPPYYESSPAVPVGLYGWTKLLGDVFVLRAYPDALVARTSVLFGEAGASRPTFSEALLAGDIGTVYVDRFRNHTPVHWLARSMLQALRRGGSGLLLLCGGEDQSRSAFAEALMRHLGKPMDGISMGYGPPGTPRLLSLRPRRAAIVLERECPDLEEGLAEEYRRVGS